MNRIIISMLFSTVALFSHNALAQDGPVTWDGLRVGGYAEIGRQGDHDVLLTSDLGGPLPSFGSALTSGGAIGVLAGYDWEFGPLIVGLEGTVSAGGSFSSASLAGGIVRIDTDIERRFGAAFGPRIGYGIGQSLVYASVALDVADLRYRLDASDPGLAVRVNDSHLSFGAMVGLGLDTRVTDTWSLDLGYRYTVHPSDHYSASVTDLNGTPTGEQISTDAQYQAHAFRVGLIRHF